MTPEIKDERFAYKRSLTVFLSSYFDFAYFFLCCPFRFVYNKKTGRFLVKRSLIQVVAFTLITVLSVPYYLARLRREHSYLQSGTNTSPTPYFNFLKFFLALLFNIACLWHFVFHYNAICNTINFIQEEFVHFVGDRKTVRTFCGNGNASFKRVFYFLQVQSKLFTWSVCITFSGMALNHLIRHDLLAPVSTWDITVWNRKLISTTRHAFLAVNHSEWQAEPHPEDIYGHQYFLAILAAVVGSQMRVLEYFSDLYILLMVITVWVSTQKFAGLIKNDLAQVSSVKSIQRKNKVFSGKGLFLLSFDSRTHKENVEIRPKLDWQNVYRIYKSIKELCEITNQTVGTLLSLYMATYIMIFSISLDGFITTQSVDGEAIWLLYFGTCVCILYLAATACNNVSII